MKQNDEVVGLREISAPETKSVSRRKMMSALGIGGLASVASLALAQPGINEAAAQFTRNGPSDLDILNFALNLEYLEAQFYTVVKTGGYLPDSLTSGPGFAAATGGAKVPMFDPFVSATANELRVDEVHHVEYLRSVITQLGGTPIGQPAINLDAAGFGYANEDEFLVLSRIFEDVGVSAYTRAAPLIFNPDVLGAAGRVLATEAYHAGNIRLQVVQRGLVPEAIDPKDQPPYLSNLFPTDSRGLAVTRTVAQIIAVVSPFFPNGLNGNIK